MDEQHRLLDRIHGELVKVRHLLDIMMRDELKKPLEATVITKDRRKVCALLDGLLGTEGIAESAGVSQRSVQLLVKELLDAGLVPIETHGHSRRAFVHFPAEGRIRNVAGE